MTGYLRASAGLSGRWRELFCTCARLADGSKYDEDREEAVLQATCIPLCLPAQRIGQLTEQIQDMERRLARLVERHASQLLSVADTPSMLDSGDAHLRFLRFVRTGIRNRCRTPKPPPEPADGGSSFFTCCHNCPYDGGHGCADLTRWNTSRAA
ncbi:hypothetical protein [Streptomyces lydicus]|uniref:hypothetical protein n=1 Tax=Streptomyces lydicus TaxID=47763 RepID=UPI00378F8294